MFASKWCREVARLVGEVEYLMQTMGSMNRICEGVMASDNHSAEGNRKGKKTAGSISSEDNYIVIESEVERDIEGEDTSRQLTIRSATQFLATHGYEKNPDGPVGNELDLNEGDTVIY